MATQITKILALSGDELKDTIQLEVSGKESESFSDQKLIFSEDIFKKSIYNFERIINIGLGVKFSCNRPWGANTSGDIYFSLWYYDGQGKGTQIFNNQKVSKEATTNDDWVQTSVQFQSSTALSSLLPLAENSYFKLSSYVQGTNTFSTSKFRCRLDLVSIAIEYEAGCYITTQGKGTGYQSNIAQPGYETPILPSPVNTGYKLVGWKDITDENKTVYSIGNLPEAGQYDIIYESVWEPISYEVHTYIGQECIDKQTCIYNETYYITPDLNNYMSNGNNISNIFRRYYIKYEEGTYSSSLFNNSITKNFSTKDGAIVTSQVQWWPTIVYDSIFSFNDWRVQMEEDRGQNPIATLNNATIKTMYADNSSYSPSGYMLISNEGVAEGTLTSHRFKVIAGQSYNIDFTVYDKWEEPNWDVYIFFEDEDGTWINFNDSTNRISYNEHHNILYPAKENMKIKYPNDIRSKSFVAPEGAVQAQIRIDANGSNHEVQFYNFRIYPSNKRYMSYSITNYWRNDIIAPFAPYKGLAVPKKYGYVFKNWQDENGKIYTSDSTFPEENLILYSQWEKEGFGIHNGDSSQRVIKAFIGEHPIEKIFIGEKEI